MRAVRAIGLTLLLVGACRDASTPLQPRPSSVVPGQYIVVFQDAVSDPDGLAQSLVQAQGGTLLHTYTSALKGFAARLPDAAVATLGRDPLVAYIEPDRKDSLPGTQQMDASGDPWGLDRIDQRALPLSGSYTYASTGAGVHVYLIDTGIWTPHREFEGRADNVYDAFGLDGMDCQGHGTAVAGVVGAATYGVAKGVSLHGVRIADCNFGFSTSGVVAGIDWVTANHRSPAVANIPMQADPSTALATAIKKLWDSGVFVGTTAGNHNQDACLEASGATPFAVAASARTDARADFSNWGPCVKIYAPGVDIKTTWPAGVPGTGFAVPHADSTATVSGTSFAAPHVTGVAALYKATFGDAASDVVANWILNNATPGVITGNVDGTPNLLLYSLATGQPPPVANFTSSCTGLTCSFDASSSTAQATATYSWTWGDAATGTGKTATHTYGAAGSYSVTLTVTDGGGSNSVSETVTVSPANQPPTANFTFSCAGLGCSFDASSSTAQATASYSWTWGDATTGAGKTATHSYATGGTYSVTLTVTDAGGSNSKTQTVSVSAPPPPPVANFTVSCTGLTCNFDASSSTAQATATYSWTWGDGTPAGSGKTATHSYASGGTYSVTLTVADAGGSNSQTRTVSVTPPNHPPVVSAGPNETVLLGVFYTLSATFSDPDNDGPWSYTIDWGDGSSTTGTTSSQGTITAGHSYLLGSYTIRVTVTDSRGASGSDSKVLTVIIGL